MQPQPRTGGPWHLVDQDAELWRALYAMFKASNEAMPASAKRMEVSRTDMGILEMIMSSPATPGEIAKHLKITPAAVSIAVNRLAERGHVERCGDPADARRVLVRITDSARTDVASELQDLFAEIHRVVDRVPAADRQVLTDFLQQITDVLQAHSQRG